MIQAQGLIWSLVPESIVSVPSINDDLHTHGIAYLIIGAYEVVVPHMVITRLERCLEH